MLESLLQQTTIPILEKVTSFGQRRHQVLAGNIANIDTPDYKMRDLPVQDFENALQQAIQARRENITPDPNPSRMNLIPKEFFSTPGGDGSAPFSPGMSQVTAPQLNQLKDYFSSNLHTASEEASKNVTFHDGGNRSIELESMEMVKNSSMQSFAIQVMAAQMSTLESVISERVT